MIQAGLYLIHYSKCTRNLHMHMTLQTRAALLAIMLMAFVVINSITPVAEALNLHSVDFEKGSSQFLEISDASQVGLEGSTNMTVEAWVKFESLPVYGADGMPIVSKAISVGDRRSYSFYYSGTGNSLRWVNQSDGFIGVDAGVSWIPTLGVWYHVAASKSDDTVSFYVNGSQVGSPQIAESVIYNSDAPFRIGSSGNGDVFFDGLIDDVRVWNVARSASDIINDYDRELAGTEPGLDGYWKFNGGSLEDVTANDNDLTNHNGVTFSVDVPFTDADPVVDVEKTVSESVATNSALQNDDELILPLQAGKTYRVQGELIASTEGNASDLRIGFAAPLGSVLSVDYASDSHFADAGTVTDSSASERIHLVKQNEVRIVLDGTVTAGADGGLSLLWAQWLSHKHAITIKEGSTLSIEEL